MTINKEEFQSLKSGTQTYIGVVRKANKPHKCDTCEGDINKGEKYDYFSKKIPKYYDTTDKQIGIEYFSAKMCSKCYVEFQLEQDEMTQLIQENN